MKNLFSTFYFVLLIISMIDCYENAFLSESKIISMKVINKEVLATGLTNGNINLVNLSNGKVIKTLLKHTHSVFSLELLKNETLISGSADHTINVWNTTTYQLIRTLKGHTDCILCLTLLHDGTLVSGSKDNSIKFWNVTSGKVIKTLSDNDSPIRKLMVINSQIIISSSENQILKVWNTLTGQLVKKLNNYEISSFSILSNKIFVSATSNDLEIQLWNSTSFELIKTIQVKTFIRSFLRINDQTLICGGVDLNVLQILNTTESKIIKTLHNHSDNNNVFTYLEILEYGKFVSVKENSIQIWSHQWNNLATSIANETFTPSNSSITINNLRLFKIILILFFAFITKI